MNQTNASQPQPNPMPGKQRVLDAVIADFQERAESGRVKYGTYLETHNGRDALWDAYQEAVDLVMYLKQALLEREGAAADRPKSRYSDTLPPPIWGGEPVVTPTLTLWVVVAGMVFLVGVGFMLGLAAAAG